MVSHAARPGVGAVGAKLLYPDGRVQHAGVVLGMESVAAHPLRQRTGSADSHFGFLQLTRNVSCVTAACMLMPRHVFDEVGGFDEVNLAVAYNDVDLCLKVRQAGYSIVWTPYAALYHRESMSRGADAHPDNIDRALAEVAHMQGRWGDHLRNDPYYSPNLSLRDESMSLAFPPRAAKPWQQFLDAPSGGIEQALVEVSPEGFRVFADDDQPLDRSVLPPAGAVGVSSLQLFHDRDCTPG